MIITDSFLKVFCAANNCGFNDNLLEVGSSDSGNSSSDSETQSFNYNATIDQFPQESSCYDDIVEDINDRTGSNYELTCCSSSKTVLPQDLKNYNKVMRKVLNNPNFEQKITYVKCS